MGSSAKGALNLFSGVFKPPQALFGLEKAVQHGDGGSMAFSLPRKARSCFVLLMLLCTIFSGTAGANLRRDLESAVRLRSESGIPVRHSGEAYAVDAALFLLYAVESGNRTLFDALLPPFKKAFFVPFGTGARKSITVGWKRRGQEPPDASGTTETMLSAKALWLAGVLWKNESLREESLSLIRGYLAHESGKEKSWQIRNYYNYGTRAFATNSYALGYFPDFLFEVARSGLLPEASEAAARSLRFLRNASLPNGLFSSSFDPELRTLFPEAEFSFHFSPDFRIKPGDSAFIALEMAESDPSIPRRTLALLEVFWPSIPDVAYGFLSLELSMIERRPQISTGHLAAVYRLALRFDQAFAREIWPVLNERAAVLLSRIEGDAWTWDAVNVLLALAEEERSGEKPPVRRKGVTP